MALIENGHFAFSPSVFSQLIEVVSFNLAMGLPLLYGSWHCQYQKCLDADVYRVPSLYGLIGYLLVTMLCHDVLFYHAHRCVGWAAPMPPQWRCRC